MATVSTTRTAGRWNPANWVAEAIVALLVMSWWKRICLLAVFAGAIGLAANLFGSLSLGFRTSWGKLPASALDRAPLFAKAWMAHDEAAMKRFVRPTDEAKLAQWIAANPVPASLADVPPAARQAKTIFFEKDDMDGAVVKVQVSGKTEAAAILASANRAPPADAVVLRMTWAYSGGHWLFAPDSSLAIASAAPAAGFNRPMPAPAAGASETDDSPRYPSAAANARQPAPASASRNVVIPSTVPPWARAR